MAGLCQYKLRDFSAALENLAYGDVTVGLQRERGAGPSGAPSLRAGAEQGGDVREGAILTELTRVDKKSPEIIAAAGIAGLRQPWLPAEVPEAQRDLVYKLGDAMASAMEF